MAKTTTTKTTSKTPGKPSLFDRVKPGGSAAAKGASGKSAPAKGARGSTGVSENRLFKFLREVRIEMGKVTWPPRPELIQATGVVIVAVAIAAVYIGLLDLVWSSLVNLARLS
jgi:preprotein translocase subunit SecE